MSENNFKMTGFKASHINVFQKVAKNTCLY